MNETEKLKAEIERLTKSIELERLSIIELYEVQNNIKAEIERLKSENIKLRNCENCKHEFHPFIEGTPCLGCCSDEHEFLNWEGKK